MAENVDVVPEGVEQQNPGGEFLVFAGVLENAADTLRAAQFGDAGLRRHQRADQEHDAKTGYEQRLANRQNQDISFIAPRCHGPH